VTDPPPHAHWGPSFQVPSAGGLEGQRALPPPWKRARKVEAGFCFFGPFFPPGWNCPNAPTTFGMAAPPHGRGGGEPASPCFHIGRTTWPRRFPPPPPPLSGKRPGGMVVPQVTMVGAWCARVYAIIDLTAKPQPRPFAVTFLQSPQSPVSAHTFLTLLSEHFESHPLIRSPLPFSKQAPPHTPLLIQFPEAGPPPPPPSAPPNSQAAAHPSPAPNQKPHKTGAPPRPPPPCRQPNPQSSPSPSITPDEGDPQPRHAKAPMRPRPPRPHTRVSAPRPWIRIRPPRGPHRSPRSRPRAPRGRPGISSPFFPGPPSRKGFAPEPP